MITDFYGTYIYYWTANSLGQTYVKWIPKLYSSSVHASRIYPKECSTVVFCINCSHAKRITLWKWSHSEKYCFFWKKKWCDLIAKNLISFGRKRVQRLILLLNKLTCQNSMLICACWHVQIYITWSCGAILDACV